MKKALLAFAGLAGACSTMPSPDAPGDPALSLAQAERDFAAHSVRENARAAFLAHFAADGLLVRNGTWTRAHPSLEAQTPAPVVLDWHPVYVEAARSGDLGLSTGPWTLTPRDPAKAVGHGQFVSVWRRDGGTWKVMADIGIAHAEPMLETAPLQARVAAGASCRAASPFEAAERELEAAAARDGPDAALRAFAASDLRFYREGLPPRVGLDAAAGHSGTGEGAMRYSVEGARVARSGELGYAYGHYEGASQGARGAWMRVWRCDSSGWRVAVDVANAAR